MYAFSSSDTDLTLSNVLIMVKDALYMERGREEHSNPVTSPFMHESPCHLQMFTIV